MTDEDKWEVNKIVQEAIQNLHTEPSPKTLAMFEKIQLDMSKLIEIMERIVMELKGK